MTFLVADDTAVLGCAVVTLAPLPTLTPLPDADTPDFCNESLPLVGLSLLVANPSPVSLGVPSPSAPFASVDVVGVETFNRTLSSLPEPVPFADGVEAAPLVRAGVLVLGPGVELVDRVLDFEVPITLCNASGNVAEAGGAKMESALLVSCPENAGLGPASLPGPCVMGDSAREGDVPFAMSLAMLQESARDTE